MQELELSARIERAAQIREEYAILGCVLNHKASIAMLATFVTNEEVFQDRECRAFFAALKEIGLVRGKPEDISPVSVCRYVEEAGLLGEFTGNPDYNDPSRQAAVFTAYFDAEEFLPAIPPDALEAACAVLNERWQQQRMASICARYAAEFRSPGANPGALQPQLQAELESLTSVGSAERRVVTLQDAAVGRLAAVREFKQSGKSMVGLSTGYPEVDQETGGLQPSTLTILGGAYKDGKTSVACQIGIKAALDAHRQVLMFSYEMTADEIADRFFAHRSGVNPVAFRMGRVEHVGALTYDAWEQSVCEGRGSLARMPNFHICESAGMTVADIEAVIRDTNYRLTHAGREPLALVIVDYIQLVTATRARREDVRHEEVSRIGWALAQLSKRIGTAILALSQLNTDGQPSDCKALMGHCDSWWKIYREVPGQDFGLLYLERNRGCRSGLGYAMRWDNDRLVYHLVGEIDDPAGMLREAKAAVKATGRGRGAERPGTPEGIEWAEVGRHRKVFAETNGH